MIIQHGGHIFEKFTRCAKVCGLFLLDCAFRILIGWAGKLRSHGKYAVYKSTFEALRRPAPSLCLQKKVHTRLRRKRSRLFEGLVVFICFAVPKKNENANLGRYVGSGYPVSRARDTWSIRAATQILAGKLIFAEGGKPESLEKSPRSQIEINQSQPTYEPWIESRSQWWEARMMTSEDGLKPKSNHNPNPNLTLKKEAKERNLEKGKKPVRV